MNQKGILPLIAIIFVLLLAFFVYAVVSRNPELPLSGMQAFAGSALLGFLFLVAAIVGAIVIFFFALRFFSGKGGTRRVSSKPFPKIFGKGRRKSIYEGF